MSKILAIAITLALLSTASAYAAGCPVQGNNGWGNGGTDGTNGGSDEGGESGTKLPDEQR
jgi:hypothetical protein